MTANPVAPRGARTLAKAVTWWRTRPRRRAIGVVARTLASSPGMLGAVEIAKRAMR